MYMCVNNVMNSAAMYEIICSELVFLHIYIMGGGGKGYSRATFLPLSYFPFTVLIASYFPFTVLGAFPVHRSQ